MAKQFTAKTSVPELELSVEWTETRGETVPEAIELGHFKDESEVLNSAYKDRRVGVQDNQRRAMKRDAKSATAEALTAIADKHCVGVIQRGPVSKGTIDAQAAGLSKKQVASFREQGFTVVNAPGE